jgi:hypothetical protein
MRIPVIVTSVRDHDVGNQSGKTVSDFGPRFCFPRARDANAVEEIFKKDRNTKPNRFKSNKLIGI